LHILFRAINIRPWSPTRCSAVSQPDEEGTMVGQQAYGWWAWGSPAYLYQATVQVDNRNTFAEVALGRVNFVDSGENFYAAVTILQVVSANGTENFTDELQAIYRNGMTSITMQITVISAFANARMMLNYWS
jgi:hypothetical protein